MRGGHRHNHGGHPETSKQHINYHYWFVTDKDMHTHTRCPTHTKANSPHTRWGHQMFSIWFPFDRSHKGCDLNTRSKITHQIKGRPTQPWHVQYKQRNTSCVCVTLCEWWKLSFHLGTWVTSFGLFVTETRAKKDWTAIENLQSKL